VIESSLSDECREHHEGVVVGAIGGKDDRAMSEEPGEVEVAMSDALEPVADALAGDARDLGRRGECVTTPQAVESAEDVHHPVDLAGERVGGENPLALVARATPSKDDAQLAMVTWQLESAADQTVGQLQRGTCTTPADAARKNRVTAPRDDLVILGRVHGEYVRHHVPRRPRSSGIA